MSKPPKLKELDCSMQMLKNDIYFYKILIQENKRMNERKIFQNNWVIFCYSLVWLQRFVGYWQLLHKH
jgi:hypothetical protein